MAYKKIKQTRLSDVIMEQLESMILEGSLPPGKKLPPERELAEQFEVSRPSVREAIQQLEVRGLVYRKQGGGTFVKEGLGQVFSDPLLDLLKQHPESQFDLLEFRHALEGISAYYAAMRGTDTDLEHIQQAYNKVEQVQASGSLQDEAKALLELYVAVAEGSHNLVVLHLVRSVAHLLEQNIYQNLQVLSQKPQVSKQLNQHRGAIIAALMNKEPESARLACFEHLSFIEEALLQLGQEDSRIQRSLRRIQPKQER